MLSSVFLVLLALCFEFGQSFHKHVDEDHYLGQQHNREHDMNVLLGAEVSKYTLTPFSAISVLQSSCAYFILIHL